MNNDLHFLIILKYHPTSFLFLILSLILNKSFILNISTDLRIIKNLSVYWKIWLFRVNLVQTELLFRRQFWKPNRILAFKALLLKKHQVGVIFVRVFVLIIDITLLEFSLFFLPIFVKFDNFLVQIYVKIWLIAWNGATYYISRTTNCLVELL